MSKQDEAKRRILPPSDPDALAEYNELSKEERNQYYWIHLILEEEGDSCVAAERNAIAAVLQHRRLHAPRLPVQELDRRLEVARGYQIARGLSPEAAEQQALPKDFIDKFIRQKAKEKEATHALPRHRYR